MIDYMRDVKEVHTAVCRQLPSALLCGKGEEEWTYESEVSSPSVRCISAVCALLSPRVLDARRRPHGVLSSAGCSDEHGR